MNTEYEFESVQDRIVYVKPVAVADLPDEVRKQAGDLEQLFAVHTEDGEQVALVANRGLAFTLARQNDFTPVAVH